MKNIFPYIVYTAAFALAGCAAYYSVFGLSKLFSSQALAVTLMAGTLEISKLITASYLHRYWERINFLLKTYLSIAVVILMFITSIGIYGFLVSAYQATADQLTIIDKQTAVIDMKRTRFQEQSDSYKLEKEQITESISELSKGLSNNVIQYKDNDGNIITTTSSATRKSLESQLNDSKEQRDKISIKLESVTDSITKLDLKILDIESNNDIAAELGPLRYISEIMNKPMNIVVNWFILIFIFVFDPLAITLLIAAQTITKKTDTNDTEPVIDNEPDLDLWDTTLNDGLDDDLIDELDPEDKEWIENQLYQETEKFKKPKIIS